MASVTTRFSVFRGMNWPGNGGEARAVGFIRYGVLDDVMAFWIDADANDRTAPTIRFVGDWTAFRKSTPVPWEVYQLDPAIVPPEAGVTSPHQRIPELIEYKANFLSVEKRAF